MCGSLFVIVLLYEFFDINFPLPHWDVFVLLSVHTFLPNPLSLCMCPFLHVEFTFSFFPFLSLPLSTYFSHPLPGQVVQQSGLEDIHWSQIAWDQASALPRTVRWLWINIFTSQSCCFPIWSMLMTTEPNHRHRQTSRWSVKNCSGLQVHPQNRPSWNAICQRCHSKRKLTVPPQLNLDGESF